jgi:hypothetical protein
MGTRQLVHLYQSTHWEILIQVAVDEIEMCGSIVMHEVHFSTSDQQSVGREIRHVVFQESFLILPYKYVWKCVGSNKLSPQTPAQILEMLWKNHMWIFI